MSTFLETALVPQQAAPITYTLAELGTVDVQSIYAELDGTAASGEFRPVLTIRAQNGNIIGRTFPGDTVVAGDTAKVTWAPFLDVGLGGAQPGMVLLADTVFTATHTSLDYHTILPNYAAFLWVCETWTTNVGGAIDQLRINNDSGSHYHWSEIYGDGGTAKAQWDGGSFVGIGKVSDIPQSSADTQIPAVMSVYVPNYASASVRKTWLVNFGLYNTHAQAGTIMGGWNQAAAITRMERVCSAGSFDIGCRFLFYGLRQHPVTR